MFPDHNMLELLPCGRKKYTVLFMAVVAPCLVDECQVCGVTIDTYLGLIQGERHVIIPITSVGKIRVFWCSLGAVFAKMTVKAVVSRIGIRLKDVVTDTAGVRRRAVGQCMKIRRKFRGYHQFWRGSENRN